MRSFKLAKREGRPEYPFEVFYEAIATYEVAPGSVKVERAVDEFWALFIALRLLEKRHGLKRGKLSERWLLEPRVVKMSPQAVLKLKRRQPSPQRQLAL